MSRNDTSGCSPLPGTAAKFNASSVVEPSHDIKQESVLVAIEVLDQDSGLLTLESESKTTEKSTYVENYPSDEKLSEPACRILDTQESFSTQICAEGELENEVDHFSNDTSTCENRGTYTEAVQKNFNPIFSPDILLKLLEASETGKEIAERAKTGELSETKQLQLARIIAKYHINLNKKLTADDLQNYSLSVVALFKNEKQVREWIENNN